LYDSRIIWKDKPKDVIVVYIKSYFYLIVVFPSTTRAPSSLVGIIRDYAERLNTFTHR
jgi:hypothetical protein